MAIFIFLKFGMAKLFETLLQNISNVKMNTFHMKMFEWDYSPSII